MSGLVEATGGLLNSQLSASKDALLTTNYLDDYITQGRVYSYNSSQALAAGTPLYAVFSAPDSAALNGVFLIPRAAHPTSGYVITNVYEGTDYTGTAVTPICRNLDTTPRPEALSTLEVNATGTTTGALLPLTVISGTESTNQSSGGGGAVGGSFNSVILKRGEKYLIEITPSDSNTCGVTVEFAEI